MKTSSYVGVDYQKLDELIQQRGTSRAKCAAACGIQSGTLGNSFLRKSKMKAEYVIKIAAFLSVSPLELLERDTYGNIKNYDDWEAVTDKEAGNDSDRQLEKSIRDSFADICDDLNWDGSEKLYTISRLVSDLIRQIPKYRKNSATTKETDQDQK